MKRLNDFRVLFKYYREKHSDLMIDINSNRRSIVNMEDDNWSTELEKTRGTITKFNMAKNISDNNVNDVSSDSQVSKSSSSKEARKRRYKSEDESSSK
jgi:hypothetical protein